MCACVRLRLELPQLPDADNLCVASAVMSTQSIILVTFIIHVVESCSCPSSYRTCGTNGWCYDYGRSYSWGSGCGAKLGSSCAASFFSHSHYPHSHSPHGHSPHAHRPHSHHPHSHSHSPRSPSSKSVCSFRRSACCGDEKERLWLIEICVESALAIVIYIIVAILVYAAIFFVCRLIWSCVYSWAQTFLPPTSMLLFNPWEAVDSSCKMEQAGDDGCCNCCNCGAAIALVFYLVFVAFIVAIAVIQMCLLLVFGMCTRYPNQLEESLPPSRPLAGMDSAAINLPVAILVSRDAVAPMQMERVDTEMASALSLPSDPTTRLKQLDELWGKGIITQDEYTDTRKDILADV